MRLTEIRERERLRYMKIGILSDTHGLLRPEIVEVLRTCDAIIHGGDINKKSIMEQLKEMAPLYIVRGNNDKEWAEGMAEQLDFWLAGVHFFLIHSKKEIPQPVPEADVIVFGHSHKYFQEMKDGRLWLNPGSCGPGRFGLAVTMAVMTVTEGEIGVEKVILI